MNSTKSHHKAKGKKKGPLMSKTCTSRHGTMKQSYRTEAEAKSGAEYMQVMYSKPMHYYRCLGTGSCGLWHAAKGTP